MASTWWVSGDDLDKEQALAVQEQSENESFLVKGPAGSGKTNILLLRSKWLRLKGRSNVKIVVFTKTLRDFIRSGCEEYGLPEQDVITSIQFFRSLLSEYGISIESTGAFEGDRLLLSGKVQTLLEEKGIGHLYEALLVDESQDYTDTELMIFRRLSQRLILAADSKQSIYRTTHTSGTLETLVNSNVVELKYHYRSGIRICTVADAILKDSATFHGISGNAKYLEDIRPSSISASSCNSLNEQFDLILESLPGQLDAYPNELVGVLFPKREQVVGFSDALQKQKQKLGADAHRVRLDTMHGGKGLEFRAVHLGGCESLYRMGPVQKRLIYTSILRGRTAVRLYYTGAIPGYLDSALGTVSPPKSTPSLNDLFSKSL